MRDLAGDITEVITGFTLKKVSAAYDTLRQLVTGKGVGVMNRLVDNDRHHDHLNHKSCNYLRTLEISKVIARF